MLNRSIHEQEVLTLGRFRLHRPIASGAREADTSHVHFQLAEARGKAQVMLAQLPGMIGVVIRASLERTGIPVTEVDTCREAFERAAEDLDATVVVAPATSVGLSDEHAEALLANPRLRILTVTASQEHADVFELRVLGADVDCQGVVQAICTAIAAPAQPIGRPAS